MLTSREQFYSEEDSEQVESESYTNGEQLLEVIKQKLFSQNDMGPEINDKLADIANNRWAEIQEKKIVNERVKRYKMPRNCENIVVPRVNDEIWLKLLLPSISKGSDIKLASIEKCITASTAAVLECANDLLKAKKRKSRFDYNAMFVKLTDAVSL